MTTLDIRDWELDETVATVTDEGDWDAESPLAEEVLDKALDDDGSVGWRAASMDDEGEVSEHGVLISPGETGYLYAVGDALPSPLEADITDLEMPEVDPSDGDDKLAQKMWDDLVNLAERKLS